MSKLFSNRVLSNLSRRAWRGRFKNEEGFTLLEAIISIAALAVLSVFIIEMFIVSANANARAQNMDIASNEALTAIEAFKAYDDGQGYKLDPANANSSVVDKENGYSILRLFDSKWNEITADYASGTYPYAATPVRFVESIEINRLPSIQTEEHGAEWVEPGEMCDISIKIVSVNNTVNLFRGNEAVPVEKVLAEYETSKYFSY